LLDPLLAHWQYGLGRAVAFTSDAKPKWGKQWLNWDKYRQFWSQIGQWSLRRLDSAEFTTEVSVEKGEGVISLDAADEQGNYRNFLNLQTIVVSPKGERQTVRLEQVGPGHYEARFPTKEVGSYLLNLLEMKDGQVRGSQVIGASVNYSPEFTAPEPNLHLLQRLSEAGNGKMLEPTVSTDNPFLLDRKKTFQPRDLWEWLLRSAILLFVLDVGVRRIQIDREEVARLVAVIRRYLPFLQPARSRPQAEESLAALLARRDSVRSQHTAPAAQPDPALFKPQHMSADPLPGFESATQQPPAEPIVESTEAHPAATPPGSTTSRLLEAKRRAQRRGGK